MRMTLVKVPKNTGLASAKATDLLFPGYFYLPGLASGALSGNDWQPGSSSNSGGALEITVALPLERAQTTRHQIAKSTEYLGLLSQARAVWGTSDRPSAPAPPLLPLPQPRPRLDDLTLLLVVLAQRCLWPCCIVSRCARSFLLSRIGFRFLSSCIDPLPLELACHGYSQSPWSPPPSLLSSHSTRAPWASTTQIPLPATSGLPRASLRTAHHNYYAQSHSGSTYSEPTSHLGRQLSPTIDIDISCEDRQS